MSKRNREETNELKAIEKYSAKNIYGINFLGGKSILCRDFDRNQFLLLSNKSRKSFSECLSLLLVF